MQAVHRGPDAVFVFARLHIFCASFQCGFKDAVGVACADRVSDQAHTVEPVAHRAGCAKIAAIFAECRAHIGCGAVAVVGQCLNDDRNAAGAIAFIAHFIIAFRVAARCLIDCALDIILGHRLCLGRIDRKAKARVHVGIGHAHFRRHGNFARQLRKLRRTLLVLRALTMLDILEFAMACHGSALLWLKDMKPRPYIRHAPLGKTSASARLHCSPRHNVILKHVQDDGSFRQ